MNNLKSLITIAGIVLSSNVFSQTITTITGSVNNSNNKPLQSVTISLLKSKDSSLVKTAVTDAAGSYKISTNRKGSFLLS